jgi:hypothetical protein
MIPSRRLSLNLHISRALCRRNFLSSGWFKAELKASLFSSTLPNNGVHNMFTVGHKARVMLPFAADCRCP